MDAPQPDLRPRSRTLREFALAHTLSESTVRRLISRGELIARKAGRLRVIITAEDEARWLANLPPAQVRA